MDHPVQLIECPRDAMQGWPDMIPTDLKTDYLNALLKVGFHSLDFGSFVSPRAIPQMADTREVLARLHWRESPTALLAIVANTRGAEEAAACEGIRYLGYPLSVSEQFQLRNTRRTVAASLGELRTMTEICRGAGKEMVVYLSMAFGNPYGDEYTEDDVLRLAGECRSMGIGVISLADTVGLAWPEQVGRLAGRLIADLPDAVIGVHLHSSPDRWREKVLAAWDAGCRRFDGALMGIGGCPMAGDALVGNMDTDWLIGFFSERTSLPALDAEALSRCRQLAAAIFRPHAS